MLEYNKLLARRSLSQKNIPKYRVSVVIELIGVVLSQGARFRDDRILPHGLNLLR